MSAMLMPFGWSKQTGNRMMFVMVFVRLWPVRLVNGTVMRRSIQSWFVTQFAMLSQMLTVLLCGSLLLFVTWSGIETVLVRLSVMTIPREKRTVWLRWIATQKQSLTLSVTVLPVPFEIEFAMQFLNWTSMAMKCVMLFLLLWLFVMVRVSRFLWLLRFALAWLFAMSTEIGTEIRLP